MEHIVDAVRCAAREIQIRKIPFEKLYLRQVIEIAAAACDEIIGNADAMAAAEELFRKVRSDEPGAAGHEKLSHVTDLSNIRARSQALDD